LRILVVVDAPDTAVAWASCGGFAIECHHGTLLSANASGEKATYSSLAASLTPTSRSTFKETASGK